MMESIEFSCGGKCRICPFPGANCKEIRIKPDLPEREVDENRVCMSPDIEEALMKKCL